MFFKYRPAQVRDLPECRLCLRDHFAYDAAALDDLAALWRELIEGGAANATVIEDVSRPLGQRIIWYCINGFIPADYAAYLRTEAPPIIGLEILRRRRAGCSPLLTRKQLQHANSGGGVWMITLSSGTTPEIMGNETERAVVARKITDYMLWAVSSYRLNEALIELYTEYEYAWAEGYGYFLRTEYKEYLEKYAPPWLAGSYRPRLYSSTRREAEAQAGSPIVELFHYEPPCFFFTPSEQELLHCALLGDTDEELAEFLNVSAVTIKKRWVSIYERVAAVNPALLGSAAEDMKRGPGKKRRLLQYLQHHLEELRPVIRPK